MRIEPLTDAEELRLIANDRFQDAVSSLRVVTQVAAKYGLRSTPIVPDIGTVRRRADEQAAVDFAAGRRVRPPEMGARP